MLDLMGHLYYTFTASCRSTRGSWPSTVQPQCLIEAQLGHVVTSSAPLGCYAGARWAPRHLRFTERQAPTPQAAVDYIAPSRCHATAPLAPNGVQCTLTGPCRRRRGTYSHAVHPKVALQAHTGRPITRRALCRHNVGTHGSLGHMLCIRRVQCRRTWGTWLALVHAHSTMQPHLGLLVTYGASSRWHACALRAPWSPTEHPQGAMHAHVGLLVLQCTFTSRCWRKWHT